MPLQWYCVMCRRWMTYSTEQGPEFSKTKHNEAHKLLSTHPDLVMLEHQLEEFYEFDF